MRGRGYAHALRKRELHLVVHMVLPTKEDHLVLQHRLIDGTRGCGVHLPRRTPSMRAPMFSPSFTTRKSLFMTRSFRPTKSGVVN